MVQQNQEGRRDNLTGRQTPARGYATSANLVTRSFAPPFPAREPFRGPHQRGGSKEHMYAWPGRSTDRRSRRLFQWIPIACDEADCRSIIPSSATALLN